ncbi:succinate dehydrogenase assembly factor 2 [Betaproteobacteria bacterium SCN2]|jgi:antitoxin CptB|nr:succinate dehydrogenase assembly factor 2 [Betaproteobacteria bacterium SCN2]
MVKGEGCEADRLRRLRWRCRRGLLELDLWLARFADNGLETLSDEERGNFEALLEEADADLLAWLEGRMPAPEDHAHMLGLIRTVG